MDDAMRILIADDVPPVLKYLEQVVEREFPNSHIRTTTDGKSLVDLARREKQDLIIADYDMPGLLGTLAIDKIRRFDKEAYIVIFSSDSSISDEAIKSGANIFARKPDEGELVEALRKYCSYIATRRSPFRQAL